MSLSAVLVTFALTVVAPGGSVAFWLLMGLFLLATYGVLLPVFAVDVYLARRFEPGSWTPTWWVLASFPFAPALFVVGAGYWYRRRRRTPSGWDGAWLDVE